jgi:hypothetical protein
MSSKSIPEPWRAFLSEVDATANQEIELHCLGGFVIKIFYGLERPTADVDVLPIATNREIQSVITLANKGSKLHSKHKVYLDVVGVATVPDSYEDRLTEMFPGAFRHLRLFALDPYDLALSKLERNAPYDRDDIKHLARVVPFDLELLRTRYREEMRSYLGIPKREDLTLQLWIEAIEEERSSAS